MRRIHSLRTRRGFSLVEVMIGMVILMIGLSFAAALSINNARLVARNQFSVHAANLAESKLEELRNADFATLGNGTDATTLTSNGGTTGGVFNRSWVIENDNPVAPLKLAIIFVTWEQLGTSQSYELRGVIGP